MQIDQAINALQEIGKALHDADRTNIILVCATIILAVSTIIFGIWDRKRQNDERFERVRPWITIMGPTTHSVVFEDGTSRPWEEFRTRGQTDKGLPKQVILIMYLKNTGIRPAITLRSSDIVDDKSFTREDLEKQKEKDMNMDLGPNQEQALPYLIDWKKWTESFEKPIFIGTRISYNNGRERSHSGLIYKIIPNFSELIITWYN